MNYPCGVITDLLPLYIDGACNNESRQAVEGHLSECEKCKNYYERMKSANDFCSVNDDNSKDMEMAHSLKNIKNSIIKKRIAASVISVAAVIVVLLGIISILKNIECNIVYNDNISVIDNLPRQITLMPDGKYLSAQIIGHKVICATQKRVELKKGDETEVRIYFYTTTSKWEDMIADKKTISYHLLTPIDNDNNVDKIFYYIGDYSNLENMDETELSKIDKESTLLWSK